MSSTMRQPKSDKARHVRFRIGCLLIEHELDLVYKWATGWLGAAIKYECNCLADGGLGFIHVSEPWVENASVDEALAAALRVIQHAKKWPDECHEEPVPAPAKVVDVQPQEGDVDEPVSCCA